MRLFDFNMHSPQRIVVALLIAVICCMSYGASTSQTPARKPAPQSKSAPQKKPDISLRPKSYTRPEPRKPVKPTIPSENRNQPDKFFLERAHTLSSNEAIDSGRQVVSGEVMFRKMGITLYCDSAYYYPNTSSLDAFGHVRMLQGDTVEVCADLIYYDGLQQRAELRSTGNDVELHHTSRSDGTKKHLYTDALDYDLRTGIADFDTGGRMYNQNTRTNQWDTLTSIRGQYSTQTRIAEVSEDVRLHNKSSRLFTDRLLYHTDTRTVDLVDRTEIHSGLNSIYTESGNYFMPTGNALLTSRSFISHIDTTGSETTLEGDSIVYTADIVQSEAFMFRNPAKVPRPMVITDTANRAILIGGYGRYNDTEKVAYASGYPLLKEYSRPDTTFLRANQIMTQTFNYGVKPVPLPVLDSLSTAADSVAYAVADSINRNTEYHLAKAWNRARFFRPDIQGVSDSITFNSTDSTLLLNVKPIVWSDQRMVAGGEIRVHFNDSTADRAVLPHKGLLVEELGEGFYNQLRANEMTAYLDNETLRHLDAAIDVQTIILPQENDSSYNKLVTAQGDSLAVDLDEGSMKHLRLSTRSGNQVTGQVIPLYQLTKAQYYLPEFVSLAGISRYSEMERALELLGKLRPVYDWYKGGWDDALGEVSLELDEYFTNPQMGIRVTEGNFGPATLTP